jgi:hypothetical protein
VSRSLLVALLVLLTAGTASGAIPIPEDGRPAPTFSGSAATPQPVRAPAPPRHPFMAPNERSNIHDDAYMSDAYRGLGPLGAGTSPRSTFFSQDCASVTFDRRGRVESICVGVRNVTLRLLDPRTLDTIASFDLPPRKVSPNPFQDFSGGGYFYLDHRDRAIIPTNDRRVLVVSQTASSAFHLDRAYDLSSAVSSSDKITSTLPDFTGRLWFVTLGGVVGTVDPKSGRVQQRRTGEEIENSFAVDETGGVFIVSDRAMYRFDATSGGAPHVTWREVYRNSGVHKPGQVDAGSGTTPTVMGRSYVSITDNADPMNVVVYRRARRVSGSRLSCTQPVFAKGGSATDNSLIGTDRSMVVENNYGYSGPTKTMNGQTTTPGLERVDLNPGGRGCHRVWHSNEIAPTVVPKLSLNAGLVYTYTKPLRSDTNDAWYFTALSFRSGRTVYKRLAGTGLGFNNNYAPISLGPDGSAYVGTLGGLVRLADAKTPRLPRARLLLRLRYRRGPGRCTRSDVSGRVVGRSAGSADGAEFLLDRRSTRVDGRPPLTVRIPRSALRRGRTSVLTADVRLFDGRRVTIGRRIRPCGA